MVYGWTTATRRHTICSGHHRKSGAHKQHGISAASELDNLSGAFGHIRRAASRAIAFPVMPEVVAEDQRLRALQHAEWQRQLEHRMMYGDRRYVVSSGTENANDRAETYSSWFNHRDGQSTRKFHPVPSSPVTVYSPSDCLFFRVKAGAPVNVDISVESRTLRSLGVDLSDAELRILSSESSERIRGILASGMETIRSSGVYRASVGESVPQRVGRVQLTQEIMLQSMRDVEIAERRENGERWEVDLRGEWHRIS
jgi:hypothetical protein